LEALQMTGRVLLVEDDDAIAEAVAIHVSGAGFGIERVADGRLAMARLDAGHFDLLLLDLMLPGVDGWDVCRHARAAEGYLPIIILSARSAEAHRVLGLELGADDYLVKPFSMVELVARVRALMRRVEALRHPASTADIRLGPWRLDPLRRELRQGLRSVELTLREFDLLHFLARHPGQPFTRSDLLARVWGSGFEGYEHTVNSHINRLRSKIEIDPRQPRLIQTVWGVGYRFVVPAEA
jgi:DNA-binding response OmpR family regulator